MDISPTPPEVQLNPSNNNSLLWQIKKLKEESSNRVKIIFVISTLFLLTVIGFSTYIVYDAVHDTSSRESKTILELTYDITEDILNAPKTLSNVLQPERKEVKVVDEVNKNEEKIEKRLIDATKVASFTTAQIDQLSSNLYPSYSKQSAKYEADEYVINFYSKDEKGNPLVIKSAVFLPKGAENEKFPLFVFGSGTTGVGDQCAPSLERPTVSNWGNYYNHLRTYAGQGFITVFPDYEGFNDGNRIHHYFNSQLEAHVLLDGTRAAMEFLAENYQPAVFYGGYSQGGHAAFAVKDFQPTYAPEIPIKGVIGFGATTDIFNLLKENADLAPYLFYSYADFYGRDRIPIKELIASRFLPTFEKDVLGKCISTVPGYYGTEGSRVYSEKFNKSLFSNTIASDFPELNNLFIENSSGLKSSKVPSLVIQGSTDPIVTVKSQQEFVRAACSRENVITYIEYKGVHHFQTRHVSFKDVTNWMRDRLAGKPVDSVCTHLNDLNKNVMGVSIDNNELNNKVHEPKSKR
jgi:pimeloyl-ACP methyl ester carboxylesterase